MNLIVIVFVMLKGSKAEYVYIKSRCSLFTRVYSSWRPQSFAYTDIFIKTQPRVKHAIVIVIIIRTTVRVNEQNIVPLLFFCERLVHSTRYHRIVQQRTLYYRFHLFFGCTSRPRRNNNAYSDNITSMIIEKKEPTAIPDR